MNAEDRILHHALTRALGRTERVDLSERVLHAWRERDGSAHPATRAPGSPTAPPSPTFGRGRAPAARVAQDDLCRGVRSPRFRRLAAALAAALVGLAAAGLLLRSREAPVRDPAAGAARGERLAEARPDGPGGAPATAPVEPPGPRALAVASSPLARLDRAPGASPASPTAEAPDLPPALRELWGGERVAVPADATPVRLELAGGGALTAWPGTVFALLAGDGAPAGGLEVRLEAGSLRLATPASGARGARSIDAGFARLEARPGSLVVAHVESDDPSAPGLTPAALAADPDRARLFTAEVSAGAAELLAADGRRELPERAAATVSSAAEDDSLAALEREAIAERLVRAAEGSDPEPAKVDGTDLAARGADEPDLFEYLDRRPTRWVLLREVLTEVLETRPPGYRRSLLRVICEADHPRTLLTADALWREHPEAFDGDELIALAERGGLEFERELRARARAWPPRDGEEGLPPAQAAAWLARRGDPSGRPALDAATALAGTSDRVLLTRIQGAIGLLELGERAPLERTIGALARGGLARLDEGALEPARDLAGTADFLARRLDAGEQLPLRWFWRQVDRSMARDADRLGSEVALRGLLEGLLAR